MIRQRPRITAKIAGRPLYPALSAFAIGYFVATFLCDLLYLYALGVDGLHFTIPAFGAITQWLLALGLAMAILAAAAGVVDFRGETRFRGLPDTDLFVGGGALIVLLEAYNFYLRYLGGSDAIASRGALLSLLAWIVLAAIPSKDWHDMYR